MNHDNMLIRIFLLVLPVTNFNCQSHSLPTSEEFDRKASSYFAEKFDAFDLSPLNNSQECTLRKVIDNDLDELSPPRLVILQDRFIIKSYFEPFLQLHFCFIQEIETGKFHFLALPQLDEYVYDVKANYREQDNAIYKLQASREPVRLNTRLLLDFFSHTEFGYDTRSIQDRLFDFRKVDEILNEAFVFFKHTEISANSLLGIAQKDLDDGLISKDAFVIMVELIKSSLRNEQHVRTFHIDGAGYLISACSVDKQTLKVTVEMFFLPDRERILTSRSEGIKYRECLDNKMRD